MTRILYRLRFTAEQRPFDTVSLNYIFPLIFLILSRHGIAGEDTESADEQITLALEFSAVHAPQCK